MTPGIRALLGRQHAGNPRGPERKRMPNHFLQYHAMRICAEYGCSDYDLWGIPDEEPAVLEAQFRDRSDGLWGVYRFKRGYGGRTVRMLGSFDRVYAPLAYRLAALIDRFRRRRS